MHNRVGGKLKKKKPRLLPNMVITNFRINFGSLPIEMYQQPTPSGQKW